MFVRDIMKRHFSSIAAGATVLAAAVRMRDDAVGCLPVTEQGRLVGIVTDRDLVLRCLAEGHAPETTAVGSIMSVETVCCHDDDTDGAVAERMRRHGLMRLPVLNRKGVLVGLVSQRDLLRQLSTKRPFTVSFFRDMTSSTGHHHRVPVHIVYVTGAENQDAAAAAAQAKLQGDLHVSRWTDAADSFTVDPPPP
jgi:CBS domain-containing protein